MESLLEQIQRGVIWKTPGGVHPISHKSLSSHKKIIRLPLPEKLLIPVKQHIGVNGQLLVRPGQQVLKGEALTKAQPGLSVPIHAPTSGEIGLIAPMPSAHPSALPELTITLLPDHQDTWCPLTSMPDYQSHANQQIIEHINNCGISGMGGAGFPTYIKAATTKKIEYLIINGAECEPYITSDDRLMQEYSDKIVSGINVLTHLLQPELVLIGIEDDKPQAIEALTQATRHYDNIIVRSIPTIYPSGGEKQLIQILTNKEVPNRKIPADIGVLVQNIGTVFAIEQAINEGKPLIERVVTVTGKTIHKPNNIWTLFGTEIKHLLDHCDFRPEPMQRVIMGGPMMGFTLPSVRIPVIKTTNCILAPDQNELPANNDEKACIRCSACADACPASLLPQQLQWFAKAKDFDKLKEHNLFDCIECGACSYVCPSEIPLVQYYRIAKTQIKQQTEDQIKAERAKERFELRNRRLEKEKEERQNRHKKTTPSVKSADSKAKVADALARVKDKQANKSGVAAAIERAKAKKAQLENQSSAVPDNTEIAKLRAQRKSQAREYKEDKLTERSSELSENTTDNPVKDVKKAAVAAAIARAKAKKLAKQEKPDTTPDQAPQDPPASDDVEDPRKAAVAAAIARAKAKKLAKQEQPDTTPAQAPQDHPSSDDVEDPRKAAVAAAIARAKAKKLAKQEQPDTTPAQAPQDHPSSDDVEDPRKAAVAAAIARAKAKKLAQQEKPDTTPDQAPQDPPASDDVEDPRKAAVAAAIARAKAKKAAKDKGDKSS